MLKRVLMRVLIPAIFWSGQAFGIDPAAVEKLAFGEADEKTAAIAALVTEADPASIPLLQNFADGNVQTAGKLVLIVTGEEGVNAITGKPVKPLPADRDDVVVNNRLRRELADALAALQLLSDDKSVRAASVKALSGGGDASVLPLVKKALEKETEPELKSALAFIAASMELSSGPKEARIAAIRLLANSDATNTKQLLMSVLEKNPDGTSRETDEQVRVEAENSLKAVESRLAWGQRVGLAFAGVSLGSILLLAALGLAITYGLMGVINMAHGELMMLGAYTTYAVQNFFRTHAPGAFDWYLLCAVPASFIVVCLIGMVLERLIIRRLYGRPLETLLATWGLSLMLIQGVRTLFGAQNVQVENPVWMSGGIEILTGVVLPWSRIVIVGFAAFVLVAVWLLLTKTRLGLFMRAVTQNRAMASCVGVPTGRIDTWAFGLGSGIAGLAGCALSQIGNVGPDLGQSYIVDSFMVVVLGGVGQLAGTIYAALGLGIVNKVLESWSGAVIAKIVVLIFIIIFIQKRPQGMFALKGRAVD